MPEIRGEKGKQRQGWPRGKILVGSARCGVGEKKGCGVGKEPEVFPANGIVNRQRKTSFIKQRRKEKEIRCTPACQPVGVGPGGAVGKRGEEGIRQKTRGF